MMLIQNRSRRLARDYRLSRMYEKSTGQRIGEKSYAEINKLILESYMYQSIHENSMPYELWRTKILRHKKPSHKMNIHDWTNVKSGRLSLSPYSYSCNIGPWFVYV